MNQFLFDELKCISSSLASMGVDPGAYSDGEVNIICDEHSLGAYLAGFFLLASSKTGGCQVNIIADGKFRNTHIFDEIRDEFGKENIAVYEDFKAYLSREHKHQKRRFFYFANLQLSEYADKNFVKAKKENLEHWLQSALDCKGNFIFVPVFNFSKPHENGVVGVAEREIEALVHIDDSFTQGKILLELENICTKAFQKNKRNIKIVRFDNIFGPMVVHTGKLGVDEIINELAAENKITFKKSDSLVYYTGCYIRQAVEAVCLVDAKGKSGNIYNAANYSFTIHDIKDYLYKSFVKRNPRIGYVDDIAAGSEVATGYEGLSNLKIKSLGWENVTPLKEAFYRTALISISDEYVGDFYVNIYQGKLERVKRIEMEIMREIDKICRENDINYFLVGGSLLGAIRHKGFIPWDDDIDIGMLREDFEKFRKLCPKILAPHLSYQSYTDEPTSHYIFDKVRLKDTYFSTKFSNRFRNIENGLFVDILVYDRTANSNFFQKVHINSIRFFRRLINIRWVGKARKGIHYRASKLLLPIMKKVPFPVYHRFFERALQMFNFKKNSKYLIDGVGQNLEKGPFPLSWFEELIDVQYEDMVFKAPKAYDEYLRHWYGNSYMQLLPLSSRNSGHALSRFDMGKYLYSDTQQLPVRPVNLSGEIYEDAVYEHEDDVKINPYFLDELSLIFQETTARKMKPSFFNGYEVNIICDEHSLAAYLAGYYMYARKKPTGTAVNVILEGECRNKALYDQIADEFEYNSDFNIYSDMNEYYSSAKPSTKKVYYYIANLQRPEYLDSEFLAAKKKNLRKWLARARNNKDVFVFIPIFNFSKPFDDGIAAVSEREVESVVLHEKDFLQGMILMQLEDVCRNSFNKMRGQLKIVRFDNIFGPFVESTSKIGIGTIVKRLIYNNEIEMKASDAVVHYTGCYIRQAVSAVHCIAAKGVKGNIYNAANYNFTLHDIKNILYEAFISRNPQVILTEDIENMPQQNFYECLSNLKIKNLGWTVPTDLSEALYRTAWAELDIAGQDSISEKLYQGKLDKIRELEIEIIKHVDKICKANGIEYFLTGGTLLGAIRHKGFVPWEDTVEIGMLREEYEKFIAVCPEALSDKLEYQSHKTDSSIHFPYDRIKLKDTSFSTTGISGISKANNGVFINIIVYDKTANADKIKTLHKMELLTLRRIISTRWRNAAVPGPNYRLTKLALPFIRILPFNFYHTLLEKALKRYEKKADSEYLIDGVGERLINGAFPAIWFKQLTDVEFEGLTFKAPQHYDDYLRRMYGTNYMGEIPEAKRHSGRDILMLDLGSYLFDEAAEKAEKKISPKGELYDKKK